MTPSNSVSILIGTIIFWSLATAAVCTFVWALIEFAKLVKELLDETEDTDWVEDLSDSNLEI